MTTLRSVLGSFIMAMGALAAVLVMENQAFADGPICADIGCAALGGSSMRDCSPAPGQTPCTPTPGFRCKCQENPLNNTECYCHATVS